MIVTVTKGGLLVYPQDDHAAFKVWFLENRVSKDDYREKEITGLGPCYRIRSKDLPSFLQQMREVGIDAKEKTWRLRRARRLWMQSPHIISGYWVEGLPDDGEYVSRIENGQATAKKVRISAEAV